jgi:Flp pilus assembly secretin CpaC
MQNKIWERFFLILVPLLLVLPFVNIVGAESESDMAITSQVVDKLQGDSELMGSRIHVETINGEVTLKGTTTSHADITRAGMLAGSIEGVKRVDNRLKRDKAMSSSSSEYGGSSRAADCPVGANWAC